MSARRITVMQILVLFLAVPSLAQELDPSSPIGMDPKTAMTAFGPPQEVFPFRGSETWQDNVVFFYADFTYLFWYGNRVWQVRYDGRFAGKPFGLSFGMSRDDVRAVIRRQFLETDDSLYFDIDEGKFPIRVRLVFGAERLSDVYVYRSDF
jgi:hypothetical protein